VRKGFDGGGSRTLNLLQALKELERGEIDNRAAAGALGLSVRQVQRLRHDYRLRGVAAAVHGNRGRRPSNATAPELVLRVRQLALGPYRGLSHRSLNALLREHHGLLLSRSTVSRILSAHGPAAGLGDLTERVAG